MIEYFIAIVRVRRLGPVIRTNEGYLNAQRIKTSFQVRFDIFVVEWKKSVGGNRDALSEMMALSGSVIMLFHQRSAHSHRKCASAVRLTLRLR